jgi:hypothetical protein
MNSFLVSLGLTRDSLLFVWGQLLSGSALIAAGFVPLSDWVGPKWAHVLTIAAITILWFSGKYNTSPLPGAKKV